MALHIWLRYLLHNYSHSKQKDRLRELIQLCFIKKNGQRRYKYLVLGRDRSYFVKNTLWFYQKVLWNWYHQHARGFDWQHICYVRWACFSIDSRHTYGYKQWSSFADLFPYSHEADFIQGLLKKNKKKLARSFSLTFRCIDDVLSLNNSRFGDFVDRIYPIELEVNHRYK